LLFFDRIVASRGAGGWQQQQQLLIVRQSIIFMCCFQLRGALTHWACDSPPQLPLLQLRVPPIIVKETHQKTHFYVLKAY
jgi:hypothetical protein